MPALIPPDDTPDPPRKKSGGPDRPFTDWFIGFITTFTATFAAIMCAALVLGVLLYGYFSYAVAVGVRELQATTKAR